MAAAAIVTSDGIDGVPPEPRGGYQRAGDRDRALETFCSAVWDRHEVRGHQASPRLWPTTGSFHVNWPQLAGDLIVASWKIAGAAAADSPLVEEIDVDLLDPPAAPEHDWHDVFGADLAAHPAIQADLEHGGPGDGVELVLERAQLSAGERAVIRPWLAGDDVATIALDIGWRPQTVSTLLNNGRYRLREPGRWAAARGHTAAAAPVNGSAGQA